MRHSLKHSSVQTEIYVIIAHQRLLQMCMCFEKVHTLPNMLILKGSRTYPIFKNKS